MRVAKSQIYTRASSLPTLRFEDQQLTSYAGLVVFQKLFARLQLKERLRQACAHLGERNLYHPAVIVQVLLVHLLLGFRKPRDIEFYQDDPLVQRLLGLKIIPSVSTLSRTLLEFDERTVKAHHVESTVRYSDEKGFGEAYYIICPVCWNASILYTKWEDGTEETGECPVCERMICILGSG